MQYADISFMWQSERNILHHATLLRIETKEGGGGYDTRARGLIRGLAWHLSRRLHHPLELSYFCIMESSEKRAPVAVYVRMCARVVVRLDTSRVAENTATCRKARLRSCDGISSVKLYDAQIFHEASEVVKRWQLCVMKKLLFFHCRFVEVK